jgi:hypothetical protein
MSGKLTLARASRKKTLLLPTDSGTKPPISIFVGGTSTLGLTLEAPVELHGILEGSLHHAQLCGSALSDLGFFCACRADGKGH